MPLRQQGQSAALAPLLRLGRETGRGGREHERLRQRPEVGGWRATAAPASGSSTGLVCAEQISTRRGLLPTKIANPQGRESEKLELGLRASTRRQGKRLAAIAIAKKRWAKRGNSAGCLRMRAEGEPGQHDGCGVYRACGCCGSGWHTTEIALTRMAVRQTSWRMRWGAHRLHRRAKAALCAAGAGLKSSDRQVSDAMLACMNRIDHYLSGRVLSSASTACGAQPKPPDQQRDWQIQGAKAIGSFAPRPACRAGRAVKERNGVFNAALDPRTMQEVGATLKCSYIQRLLPATRRRPQVGGQDSSARTDWTELDESPLEASVLRKGLHQGARRGFGNYGGISAAKRRRISSESGIVG